MTWPVVFAPAAQEAPLGYLWRLASVNGYSSVKQAAKAAGWRFNKSGLLYQGNLKLLSGQLAAITGLSEEIFSEHFAPHLPDHRIGLDERQFSLRDWRSSSPRVCVQCILAFGYMHSAFEYLLMRVCPIHQQALIEACPHCREPLTWHSRVSTHCDACKQAWPLMIEPQEIPPYQKIWMSADDRNAWEHEFGWALLQAARPFDIAHNGVEYFDSDIRFLPDLLRHAWIISTPSGRAEWQAERSLRLATLSGVSIDTANVSVELPDRVSPRPSLSDDSLLPQWFRKRYPAELRSWLVDVESAVRLLGLEHLTKYSPTESRWNWTFALRYQANELLARMDIEATCPSQQALKNRYDVRSLNRWVEHIPTQPRYFRGDWITPDDSRLTVHGADQIDLALAVKNGELSGYRQVHKGLKVIGVHRAEFKQWLNQHLHLVCESSVEQADLSRMTGMPYHILKQQTRVPHFTLKFASGPGFMKTYYSGQSVLKFILTRRERMIEDLKVELQLPTAD